MSCKHGNWSGCEECAAEDALYNRIAALERDLAEANSLAHSRAMTIERLEKALAAAQAEASEARNQRDQAWVGRDSARAEAAALKADWRIKVAEQMFRMTTCIQSGEEDTIPDIWHNVMLDRDKAQAEATALRNQRSHGINLHEKLQDEIDTLTALIAEALDGNLSPSASNPDLAPTGQRGSLVERMKAAIDAARGGGNG